MSTIKQILQAHFWGSINCESEIEEALKEIENLLMELCFTDCDSLVKIYDLPKEYKIEEVKKYVN